jgi:hypothetical protein
LNPVPQKTVALQVKYVFSAASSGSQFEKAALTAKLKAAREREKAETGKCGGPRIA